MVRIILNCMIGARAIVFTSILVSLLLYPWSLSAQPNFSYDRPSLDPVDKNAGVHGGLAPTVWFWEKAAHNNSDNFEKAVTRAQGIEADGYIPSMGFQLWGRTFELAQSGEYSDDPAFQAWLDWIEDRPHYLGRNRNGELHYGNGWGYVSPLVRLDAKDFPPGFTGPTAYYADWQAHKVSTLAEAGPTYGLFMSDFFDSHPSHGVSGVFDYFHPRMIEDFEAHSGITLASGSLVQQAADIRQNHTQAWLDYFVDGWTYNWATLIEEVRKRTGKEPLIINQTSFTAAAMRRQGAVDPRILLDRPEINPGNILFMSQALQPFVVKGVPLPESYEMIFTGIHAARTPDARIGQIISSEVDDFWKSVKENWPNLNEERRTELGKKRLKRVWLASGWGHIAMPNGKIRRSAGHWERHYHDQGTIDAQIVGLLQKVNPTKPFGPALYYSANIERKVEEEVKTANTIVDGYLGEELHPATNIAENGVPVAYFASDAIINNLNKIDAPSAWIIPDRMEELPAKERNRLAAVAPVLSGSEAINHQHPIRFSTSTSGRTVVGYAFYDQNDRLIVVAGDRIKFGESNNSLPGVTARVEIDLPGVADGQYTAQDLQSDQSLSYSITDGEATLSVPINRWDTRVLALDLSTAEAPSPLPPTNLSVSLQETAVALTWGENQEKLAGYYVYRSTSAGGNYQKLNSELLTSTRYTDNDVAANTTYYYVVRAVNVQNQVSDNSGEVVITTESPQPNAPSAPVLTAQVAGSVVSLSWMSSDTQTESWRVERSGDDGNNFAKIADLMLSGSSYRDTDVEEGITYIYRVVAVNDKGETVSNQEAVFIPKSSENPDDVPPGGEKDRTVVWQRPRSQDTVVIGQEVFLAVTTNFNEVTSVSFWVDDTLIGRASKAPYQISWLPPGAGSYNFYAVAEGTDQPVRSVVRTLIVINSQSATPGAPGQLTATVVDATVRLQWEAPDSLVQNYHIERRTTDGSFVTIASLDGDITTYHDDQVEPGTQYVYRVRALNDTGVSAYSNEANAFWEGTKKVEPVVPDSFMHPANTLSPNGDGRNDVWMAKPEGISSYQARVYDRSGKLVYQSDDYQNDWAGTSQGFLLNEGVYYYHIITPDQRAISGFVTLIRP